MAVKAGVNEGRGFAVEGADDDAPVVANGDELTAMIGVEGAAVALVEAFVLSRPAGHPSLDLGSSGHRCLTSPWVDGIVPHPARRGRG